MEEQTLDTALTKNWLVVEQKHDYNCQTAVLHITQPTSEFFFGNQGILTQRSTVVGTVQVVVSKKLCERIQYLAHQPPKPDILANEELQTSLENKTTGPVWETKCTLLLRDVWATPRAKINFSISNRCILFPNADPYSLLPWYLWASMEDHTIRSILIRDSRQVFQTNASRPNRQDKCNAINPHRFRQLEHPYRNTISRTHGQWPIVRRNIFAFLCKTLKARYPTTAVNQLKFIEQVEPYNKKIVKLMGHYVVNHQRDRDVSVQPFTYAHST